MSEKPNQSVMPVGSSWQKQSDQKFCYACAALVHASASSCPNCGAQQQGADAFAVPGGPAAPNLGAAQVFCRGCGNAIHRSAPLCPNCGAPQASASVAERTPEKSRVVAAFMAMILGGFGVHKFYLGEIGLGVLYLLFSWTFIPALIGLIEGIVYLSMSDQNFARKYG